MKVYMSFLIKDNELLEKYKETWDRVSNTIKKEVDNDPVYKKNYLKTKIKSHEGNFSINFITYIMNT